jgi:hypothetical protein
MANTPCFTPAHVARALCGQTAYSLVRRIRLGKQTWEPHSATRAWRRMGGPTKAARAPMQGCVVSARDCDGCATKSTVGIIPATSSVSPSDLETGAR